MHSKLLGTFCLSLLLATTGCDVVVRNEPDVNVQRLSKNWPPYQAPVVSHSPSGETPSQDAQLQTHQLQAIQPQAAQPQISQPVAEPRRIVPIRRAEEWDLPETAMDSLGRIGGPAVPALIEALDHNDALRRAQAAKVLARIGPEAKPSVPALVRALNDQNESVRKAAARALGQIGPGAEDAVLPLLDIIEESSSDPNVMPTSLNEFVLP